MSIRRVLLFNLVLAVAIGGCGGRADVEVATVPGDFSARQTELAIEAATRAASEPTATASLTPTPRPSATPVPPLPTVTPGEERDSPLATPGGTEEPAAGSSPTPVGTPGSVVAPVSTSEPDSTREAADSLVITGCGVDPITVGGTTDEIEPRFEEWQEISEASQAIFDAWDEFFRIYGELFTYNQIVDNTEVFEGAEAFEAVAEEQLPVLREVDADSPFHDLTQTIIATTEDQLEIGQLLTRAGTEHDPDAWDQALAISATLEQQAEAYVTELEEACKYWMELQ